MPDVAVIPEGSPAPCLRTAGAMKTVIGWVKSATTIYSFASGSTVSKGRHTTHRGAAVPEPVRERLLYVEGRIIDEHRTQKLQ